MYQCLHPTNTLKQQASKIENKVKTYNSYNTLKTYFSQNNHGINDPNGQNEEQCSILVSKYHINPTVNDAGVTILQKQVAQI